MKSRERINRCPNSDSVLYQALLPKDERVGVELEQCDDCGGVFVTDFVLKDRTDKDLLGLHLVDLDSLRRLKTVRRVNDLPCPRCSEQMESLTSTMIPDNFIIAYCRVCDALWFNVVYMPGSDPGWINEKNIINVFNEQERMELVKELMGVLDALLVVPTMNPYDAGASKDIEAVADEIPRGHATNVIAVSELVIESMLAVSITPSEASAKKKVRRPDSTHLHELVNAGQKEVSGSAAVAILIAPLLTAMRARDLLDDENIKSAIDYTDERKFVEHPRLQLTVSAKDEPRARVILSEAFRTERITDSLK